MQRDSYGIYSVNTDGILYFVCATDGGYWSPDWRPNPERLNSLTEINGYHSVVPYLSTNKISESVGSVHVISIYLENKIYAINSSKHLPSDLNKYRHLFYLIREDTSNLDLIDLWLYGSEQ